MEENFTSLELSKKLKENGCRLGTSKFFKIDTFSDDREYILYLDNTISHTDYTNGSIGAYDILWDICVKYAKEFFGTRKEEGMYTELDKEGTKMHFDKYGDEIEEPYRIHTKHILKLMQDGKKEEAEDYIWQNCLFNKHFNNEKN